MGSLSKFFLDFLMYFDIPLECFDLRLHLIVLVEQLFSLLRLVLQLSRQLVVLQNSQTSRRLELLVVQCQQIRFCLLDLV